MTNRQFRVLYREFLFRMVDLELISGRGDMSKLLGQFGALLAAFSFMFAGTATGYAYSNLPPDEVLIDAWSAEHFLIASTMMVVALFAILCWDSTFPDRRDVLVLGPLPVRPRTLFLAKIAALGTALAGTVVAVNVFTGIAYPFVLGAVADNAIAMARSFAAYWTTMLLAGLFILCSVLCVQGIAAQVSPRRYFLRVSGFLQIAAFCGTLTVYFLQPPLATPAALQAPQNQSFLSSLPSYWFLGLFQQLNGSPHPAVEPLVRRAWTGLLVALFGAAAAFGLSYFRTIRRIVDEPDIVPRSGRAGWWPRFGGPLQTAVVRFSARTLLRSRQHRVILALYAGIGFAIALAFVKNLVYGHGTSGWRQVNTQLLAASIVLLCFGVVGVRIAFAMPMALGANWIFRVTAVLPTRDYFAGVRRSLLVVAVAPAWAASAVLFLSIWPLYQAAGHLVVLGLLGCITTDLALRKFQKIPFTCSYLPGKASIHVTSGAFAIVLVALTDLFVQIEMRALHDARGYLKFVSVLAAVAVWAIRRRAALTRASDAAPRFDEAPPNEIFALELHRDGVMPR
jgi:hypothetical protein